MIRKHFRLKRIALGLALATAVVAPTAQAAVYVDGPTPGIQAGYIRAAAHQPIASEMSVQSPVSQLTVEGMRWQAMAKQYENQPGITAAGAALANQKHTALPVPITQASRRQCRTAASTGATPASAPRSPSAQRCCCSPRSGSGGDPGLGDWQASSASPGGG